MYHNLSTRSTKDQDLHLGAAHASRRSGFKGGILVRLYMGETQYGTCTLQLDSNSRQCAGLQTAVPSAPV